MSNRIMSNKYLTITTDDLLREVMATTPDLQYQLRNVTSNRVRSTREYLQVKFPQYSYTDPTGSPVVPMITIANSYAGECSLRVHTGFYRQVCGNGLMAARVEHAFPRILHLKGKEAQVKQLAYQIAAFLESVTAQAAQLQALAEVVLGTGQALKIVKDLQFSKRLTARIAAAWMGPTRAEDVGCNLYTLWNVVNEQMRLASHSESAQIDKNLNLLDTLVRLAA